MNDIKRIFLVVLDSCGIGYEPDAADFTEAAEIAALFSAADGAPMTEVDYTTVRHLKRVAGAKPGFVVYHTNWSATVSPA